MDLKEDFEDEVIEYNEGNEDNKKEKKPRSTVGRVIEVFIYLFLIFFCVYIVPNYMLQRTVVDGKSMENTLHDKESLLVDKISYRFTDPKRYEIIVFYPLGRDVDMYYVKRIYGLPGETVQIKDNNIYINGNKIDDPYAKTNVTKPGIAKNPIKLGADEYFVLGDNRAVSLDSRTSTEEDDEAPGMVKFENIAGRVFLRIWPLAKFGVP